MRDREQEALQNRPAPPLLRVRARAADAGAARLRGSQQRSAARQVRAHRRRDRHVPCPDLPRSVGPREPEISTPGATTFAAPGGIAPRASPPPGITRPTPPPPPTG